MSSLNGKPIYWSKEKNSSKLSYVPGVDIQNKRLSKQSVRTQKQQMATKQKQQITQASKKMENQNVKTINSSASTGARISLKDLCPEDKERVANLIRELAKAGEEKQASEVALNNERKQFALKLEELKSDKDRIEQEQRTLLSEFKDCQRLLVFYQQKITEEQKEVARDINRLLTETSINKSHNLSPPPKTNALRDRHLDHDVVVRDPDVTMSSNRSDVESLNGVQQFPDVTGNFGESFRPEKTSPNCSKHAADASLFVTIGKSSTSAQNKSVSGRAAPKEVKKRPAHHCDQSFESDSVKDLTKAFEERIRTLSPNGRRVALLRQKRNLEAEQVYLQKLLSEQEELLKFRQEELKKRHIEYTRRMQHYKQFGSFPSHQPINDVHEHGDQTSEPIISEYNDGSSETLNESSDDTFPRIDIGSPRRRATFKPRPNTEPLLRSRKFDPSSTGSDEGATDSFPLNSSFSSRNKERKNRRSKSLHSSYDATTINDNTNLSTLADRSRGNAKSRSTVGDSTLKSRLKRDQRSLAAEMYDSSSALTGSEKLRFPTPRRAHRNTMNNISTLSDLVSSVETSQCLSTSHNTSYIPPHSDRSRSDNTAVSVTFDPEDSQLLEDIFFIN